MDTPGILVSYFSRHEEALAAFARLRRKGYERAAWISKSPEGGVRTRDPFAWLRLAAAVATAVLFLALAEAAFVLPAAHPRSPGGKALFLSAALLALFFNFVWLRRSRFGVDRRLLKDHARWLTAGETVVLFQGPYETLHLPHAVLLAGKERPPVVCVLHPRRPAGDGEAAEEGDPGRFPLDAAQLEDHARRLAGRHRLAGGTPRDPELLRRLGRGLGLFRQACRELAAAYRLKLSPPLTSEWLLDNDHIFESNARDVRLNLPWRFYRQLPALSGGPDRGLPRIYGLARELSARADLHLDQASVLSYIRAYQSVTPLSIGELWAVPQMLRTALLENIQRLTLKAVAELREGELADFWANRLVTATRHDPDQLYAILAELTETHRRPGRHFALDLLDYLHDEESALAPVRAWLERSLGGSLAELTQRGKTARARDQISIGNAFNSLRLLSLIDWKECFEELSGVERVLRQDPAGVYPGMDFATRDRYRRAVEDLHRGSGRPQEEVAAAAVELARRAAGEPDAEPGAGHVGLYLIGDGREELARSLGCREAFRFRVLRWIYRNHTAVYFCGLGSLTAALILLALRLGLPGGAPAGLVPAAALLLLLPASQLALELFNYLVMRLLPPRTLPKMDFRASGIPDDCRTLVVVPMMLLDRATIDAEAEKLEVRYLANRENNLLFALYSDYRDAPQPHCEEDAPLLSAAVRRIEELDRRHGGGRFFLFHRERRWSESEQKFIGWERKRGKLEELNGLLDGTRPDAAELVRCGDPAGLSDIRFVITLDSDTQLPHDAARRLVETLAHPLNRARLDGEGRVVSGYGLIQPRVSPSLSSANGSPFSRLFSDGSGIDPYSNAVSDVYQDLSGEGSYHGKGIYDVRVFSRVLSGRFPEATLLSHDLIEGAHVRAGLASDIELFDESPQDYITYINRHHRWVRGDFQIAGWVTPSVPAAGGGRVPNSLSALNRWKIFDNLRRSLLPAAFLALLAGAWTLSARAGWTASVLVFAQLFFHSLLQSFTWVFNSRSRKASSSGQRTRDMLRMVAKASVLPYKAWISLDAVLRASYRMLVSRRGLLEWTSAQAAGARARSKVPAFLSSLFLLTLLSAAAGCWLLARHPSGFGAALPWLALWAASPLTGWLLVRRPPARQPRLAVSAADRQFLRAVARRTWRYFTDFVDEESSWLPPDNYQDTEPEQLAMRTSPTNIGLYLASVLSARDFGYLTADGAVDRLSLTMASVDKLERYEGHLLNWYDIRTLEALNPRYVSTVDSGNLLASLWALAPGLGALERAPLLDGRAFEGLRDACDILRQALRAGDFPENSSRVLEELRDACRFPPERAADALVLLRRIDTLAGELSARLSAPAAGGAPRRAEPPASAWARELREQSAAWLAQTGRYLAWLEVLAEKTAAELSALEPAAQDDFRRALRRAPSLLELAEGEVPCAARVRAIRERSLSGPPALLDWCDRFLAAFDKAKWLAGETLARTEKLRASVRALSDSIDMRFLYDPGRRLFSIGFNVSEGRLDRAFYDLLASEARLGSFVAIARGDLHVEHWFAMNRTYGSVGERRALLSWTGTMFEYLMPLLFQRSHSNSLLDKAAREAVEVHIAHGRRHGTPWGVSECAYADVDNRKTYQYQAFGVPELGLKRGLSEKLVIAPYAALLAAGIAPRETVENLRRLAGLGMLGELGYFEALDYSRADGAGVIVRAYMAHHQGMGFLSLANFINNGSLRRYFNSDPRVRAAEPLLYERIPALPPLYHISTRERVSSVAGLGEPAPSVRQFDTPHTSVPKTQLLSNGRYGLMVTNTGGGYSRWEDIDITRWRSDRTLDDQGSFCYIREAGGDRLWSNTYQPVRGKPESCSANFMLDRAVYRRVEHGIETGTEVIVAPEDDAEIRRITLINRSASERVLELTSYFELALAPHAADRQHPAFSKLFVETEALPEQRALLARRRPRAEGERPVYAAHRFTLESPAAGELRYDTDRRRFIGRGRTPARPMGALGEPGNTSGFVLDPIFSLRQEVTLPPGGRVQVSLVLAAGSSREQVVAAMNKYGDPRAIDRAMDFAWTSAQLELRLLRVQPDDTRRFQQLAGHLLYPSPVMRSAADRLARNRKGQAGLWAYSISGDLPIALVSISEARDLTLVRQLLQAHAYWRLHGLKADLVILNEEPGGYEQPLREKLERLVQAQSSDAGVEKPGGVYLRGAGLIPAEDLILLRAAASVVLVAARGSLAHQLGAAPETAELPAPLDANGGGREPAAALPFLELPYFNSLGGFTADGREYAVYLGPGINTPMPWVNILSNPSFGALVSETGAGFAWQGNSQRNRLTPWSNDPVLDPPSEAVYIRDEESGAFWTPTASPVREDSPYRARHGAGYTVFEHNSNGIDQELTVFVPVDDRGGEPVKLQRLALRNSSDRPRELSVTYYAEWALGESRETSQMHIVTDWDEEAGALFARNPFNPAYAETTAFAALSVPAASYTGDRGAFIGRNRSLSDPAAMERVSLSHRTGAGRDPCAALQATVKLSPGETAELTCLLGQASSPAAARALIKTYRADQAAEAALRRTREWWDKRLGSVKVRTPELSADFMINRWLPYQVLSCRLWGRSAFYQSGGAFGFRDQLQDVMALLYAHPALAREHILRAAARQFREGDVQHWWHPPAGEGVRSRISDDLLWLPYVAARYVAVTGDAAILKETVPFLEAPPLAEGQAEAYQAPAVSSERAPLFEHCRRAVKRAMTWGANGLPLMGAGDWNDGMNLVGAGGKGESVWLAWFLADVLKCMAEMSGLLGDDAARREYERERAELAARTEKFAWDGAWYLRATFDDGSPLGSNTCAEAKIDSLPQSWARLSGAADPERAARALEAAWERLVREDEGLVLLFEPPFEKAEPSPGYIKGYPPGVRENGGQYTHAAVWLAMALARGGDGTRAAGILRMINPCERSRDPETAWRYGAEPYAVAADIYRLPGRVGHGGWSWYTGSAAWMYRAWVEEILGLKVRGESLELDPVIPAAWDGFELTYRHGEAVYEIRVENPGRVERGVVSVELDGRVLEGREIALSRDLVKHRVVVRLGGPAAPLN